MEHLIQLYVKWGKRWLLETLAFKIKTLFCILLRTKVENEIVIEIYARRLT